MKLLLTAVNAKYAHTSLGIKSIESYLKALKSLSPAAPVMATLPDKQSLLLSSSFSASQLHLTQ